MSNWFVYIIQCKDGSFYTGVTDNFTRRFLEHKSGRGGWYTRKKKVKQIAHIEEFRTKQEALKREKQIKGWKREKKIKLIKGEFKPKDEPV